MAEEFNGQLWIRADMLQVTIKEAVEAERKACAQEADAEASVEGIAQRVSAAIRARGNT